MRAFNTNCIILGHKNWGESDKLIFFYSEDLGKIKAIAKGSRKISSKFTGHLETLNLCNTQLYFGPRNIILTEITTKRDNKELYNSFKKISSAIQIAEITNQLLFENQSLDNLIPLIENTLEHLRSSEKSSLITMSYIIKLLDKVGFVPDFKGLNTNLETKYLKFFQYIKDRDLNEIEKIALTKKEKSEIKNTIIRITEYHTDRSFKSLQQL